MGINWQNQARLPDSRPFTCGYCGIYVAPVFGYVLSGYEATGHIRISICPHCSMPTYLDVTTSPATQKPGAVFGDKVEHVPKEIDALYGEARNCHAIAAYTSGAMACRKILMNVAVEQGAAQNQKFFQYVDFLEGKGYVPPNGKAWIDHIRKKGNEAAHEISAANKDDLEDLLVFLSMLLKFIYEFPKRVPAAAGS